jgi:sensor histidine kinase YesM
MVENYPFLFSDAPRHRIARHVSYWAFWAAFQGFLYSFIAVGSGFSYFLRLQSSFVESTIYLIPHMTVSYMLIYFVVPRFLLKQKYFATIIWVIFLFVAAAAMSSLLSLTLIEWVREKIMGAAYLASSRRGNITLSIFLGLMAGLRGAITIGGISAAIKLMKHWYVKEQRNLILQKENMEAQLQVLKAQIHPHFLFNNLNNIYSHTRTSSPIASKMLLELSDILRYILYEGSKPQVPLQKELKLLRDYIELEQLRYGNQLEVTVNYPSEAERYSIAPLILLPFVENCFKHGASRMLDKPWVSLQLHISNDILHMKLLNGKQEEPATHSPGIGLHNVKERLTLLYPQQHELQIINEPDVYIVNLKLTLQKLPATTATVLNDQLLSHA